MSISGKTVSVTKGEDAMHNSDVEYRIEESIDLTSWSPVVTHHPPHASPVISYELPLVNGSRFARLRVTRRP